MAQVLGSWRRCWARLMVLGVRALASAPDGRVLLDPWGAAGYVG